MFLEVRGFLDPAEIMRLSALSRELKFVEGRLSNPANVTKNNMQADVFDARYKESVQIVANAFTRSREFRDFAFPKRIAPSLLSRYEPGMKYGAHADSALMSVTNSAATILLRSDLSCTVFISDPASYDGGELVLHMGTLPVIIKGKAGEAFVYPSTMMHEVRPVHSGVRLVSITFIESLIADEHCRTQLYELKEVLALEGLKLDWVSRVRLELVSQNLTRMWSS